jgi:hypothetical protein
MGKGAVGPLLSLLLLLALLLPLLFPAPLPAVYAQSEIKFRGVVWTEPNEPYDIEVMIDEVLLDPEGRLSSGSLAHVDIAEDPSRCACDWPLHRGDRVEVYARHYWYGYGDYAVGVWIYSRDNPSDGYIRRLEPTAPVVDVWTNKGGQGVGNPDGGQYAVGESITLYCKLDYSGSPPRFLRMNLIRPDGSQVIVFYRDNPPAGRYSVSGTVGEPAGERIVICEAFYDDFLVRDEVRFTVQQRATVTVTVYTTTTRKVTSTLHATATTETTTYTTVYQTTYSTSTRTWYTTVTKVVTTTVTSWTTVTTTVPAQAGYEWGIGGPVILATLLPLVFSAYAMRGRRLNPSAGENKG